MTTKSTFGFNRSHPSFDVTGAATPGLNYSVPWPYEGGGANAANAQREYWCLCVNPRRTAATKVRVTVTAGSAGTAVFAVYRAPIALNVVTIGTRLDRWTLDTTGTGDTDHTLTAAQSIAPGEYYWTCSYSEVAATFRCLVNRTVASHMGLNSSMQPIMALFRGSIAVASAAPSSAPLMSDQNPGAFLSNITLMALS